MAQDPDLAHSSGAEGAALPPQSPGLRELGFSKPAYSVNETLRMMPFGRTTLYKLVEAGRLKPVKIGRSTAFLAVDLAALLLDRKASV
jgi:predicted DNA-binding transcriptional regulator AlpA